MVYDSVRSVVVLAGGSTTPDGGKTYTTCDDVWSYNGQECRALGSSGALRSGVALAFDSKRARVLAYGGYCPCNKTNSGAYMDLQELRGGTWVKIAAIPSRPSADSRMVYDSRRDRLVLFGGSRGRQRLTDLWEFDGAEWHQRDIATPAEWRDFAMACDEARGRTVVVGSLGTAPDSTRGHRRPPTAGQPHRRVQLEAPRHDSAGPRPRYLVVGRHCVERNPIASLVSRRRGHE